MILFFPALLTLLAQLVQLAPPPVPAADAKDKPHVVMVSAEDEYRTEKTLPVFAEKHLKAYRVSLVLADPKQPNHLPEIGKLKQADLLILSVRRRPLVEADLAIVRAYVDSGKPIVALRTSSHAFAPKPGETVPAGIASWETFDRDVLGCHYTGHFSNKEKTKVTWSDKGRDHALAKGMKSDPFVSPSWLYKSLPLTEDCTVLQWGTVGENPAQPVAWIRDKAKNRGRVFYTCLGHPGDFDLPPFVDLLKRGIDWAGEK
ncbi:MAG: ThuA domain-containing protein [Gemmataceae bacterium]